MSVELKVDVEKWPLKAPFRITGYTFVEIDVVVATISRDGHAGRGEATGVYYRSENAAAMVAQIEAARAKSNRVSIENLCERLMPAAARVKPSMRAVGSRIESQRNPRMEIAG